MTTPSTEQLIANALNHGEPKGSKYESIFLEANGDKPATSQTTSDTVKKIVS